MEYQADKANATRTGASFIHREWFQLQTKNKEGDFTQNTIIVTANLKKDVELEDSEIQQGTRRNRTLDEKSEDTRYCLLTQLKLRGNSTRKGLGPSQ